MPHSAIGVFIHSDAIEVILFTQGRDTLARLIRSLFQSKRTFYTIFIRADIFAVFSQFYIGVWGKVTSCFIKIRTIIPAIASQI